MVNGVHICGVDNAVGVDPALDEVVLEQQLVLGLPLSLFFVADTVAGQQSAVDIARLDPPALEVLADVVASLVLGGVINAGQRVGQAVMEGLEGSPQEVLDGALGEPQPSLGSRRKC